MRLTRSLYSLLVCSVVFSGGGLAAVGEEDDGVRACVCEKLPSVEVANLAAKSRRWIF